MFLRFPIFLFSFVALSGASVRCAATTYTPPPGPLASPAAIQALLATVPPPAPGEIVVDFEKAEIGEPVGKWEEKGVVFELAGSLKRTPAAKPRVMFFPHLGTDHKGILNAMSTDQGVPLKMTFPGAGASSVTLVLWGSTGCPAVVAAFDRDGKLLDKKSLESVPARKAPSEPVPFATLSVAGAAIAYVELSGPRNGEFLAADEVRFAPLPSPGSNAGSVARDKNFYVFLCFGQSNMEGFPGIQEQDKTGVDERFQVLAVVDFPQLGREKGHWYPAVPPLCRPSTGLCPADYFGRTLVAQLPSDIRVGVVNVSVAGSKIELFDPDTMQPVVDKAEAWKKKIIEAYDGNPYQRLVEAGKIAQQSGVIKGILLHQGESNTNDREWPNKVKAIYERLLKDLDLKAADVPLLAGELLGADQKGACASMNAIIRELPATIPTAHVVSSEGCVGRPDHLHFKPEGYRALGQRYAEAMLPLLGVAPTKSPERR